MWDTIDAVVTRLFAAGLLSFSILIFAGHVESKVGPTFYMAFSAAAYARAAMLNAPDKEG